MLDDYTRAVLRARRMHLALDARTQRELLALLERHANELARAVANLPEDAPPQQVARLVRDLYERLERRLVGTSESGVRTQFQAIKSEMDAATLTVLQDARWRGPFVPLPPVTAAQAFLARPETTQSFRTLRQDVRGAAQGVDAIIREALVAQQSPEKLARKLRPYVLGSETFTAEELQDLRKVPKARRDDARRLKYNTDRIALTEMGNAAHEAQVQSMTEAPQVAGSRWRLSPVRGTQQDKPDECNVLADQDLYGLGKGVYPVERVPTRPHPFCRCWLQSVTRPMSEWGRAKPAPGLRARPSEEGLEDLSPAAQRSAVAHAREAVAHGVQADRARRSERRRVA